MNGMTRRLTSRARRTVRRAPTSSASWPRCSSTRWLSPADGIRSNGASDDGGLPDWQLVLKTLKEKAGFRTDLPKGEGMGVSVVESHGTIAAACATVTVSRRGRLEIEKVPGGDGRGPRHQSARRRRTVRTAWTGGLELEGGCFVNTNFDTYNLLRIDQNPDVETIFASSGGDKWGGLGEPAGPRVPPAVGILRAGSFSPRLQLLQSCPCQLVRGRRFSAILMMAGSAISMPS
jgi:hypothetical protein